MNGKGDCFIVALNQALADETLTLCHGKPCRRSTGRRFWHAWVETTDGEAIDKSNGLNVIFPVGVYYALGNIEADKVRRYTHDQAVDRAVNERTYGPWQP